MPKCVHSTLPKIPWLGDCGSQPRKASWPMLAQEQGEYSHESVCHKRTLEGSKTYIRKCTINVFSRQLQLNMERPVTKGTLQNTLRIKYQALHALHFCAFSNKGRCRIPQKHFQDFSVCKFGIFPLHNVRWGYY